MTKKRNPIAKAVTKLRPKVIPNKKKDRVHVGDLDGGIPNRFDSSKRGFQP
jgi:hypothetical protein